MLDSNTNLEFDIIVSNLGEDSFETTLDLVYPEGIYYKKTEVKEDMQGILCSAGENRTISCDIGNPLPARKIVSKNFHNQRTFYFTFTIYQIMFTIINSYNLLCFSPSFFHF